MKRVLVVDDEESVRTILKQMLEKSEFGIDTANNGEEALLKMKAFKYDLIISDINMPVMDGVALLQRSKELYPALPVVFITAYGKDKVIMEAMKSGLSDYIEKPFRMDEVLQTIKEHIK